MNHLVQCPMLRERRGPAGGRLAWGLRVLAGREGAHVGVIRCGREVQEAGQPSLGAAAQVGRDGTREVEIRGRCLVGTAEGSGEGIHTGAGKAQWEVAGARGIHQMAQRLGWEPGFSHGDGTYK